MSPISERLRNQYSRSLLGRLRLKLLERIGASSPQPSPADIRLYLARLYRERPLVAELQRHLLHEDLCLQVSFADLPQDPDWAAVVSSIEDHPVPTTFVELQECPLPGLSEIGVLVERDSLTPSGYVYSVTGLAEAHFPDSFAGRIEIRACREEPKSQLSALSSTGWKRGPLTAARPTSNAGFLARVVAYLAQKRTSKRSGVVLRTHPLAPAGPKDAELQKRLVSASQNAIACYKATVALTALQPFSLDFCISHPMDLVERQIGRLKGRPQAGPELLVYWNGEAFITSDDYIAYLAYRALGVPTVPVVVLGSFPEGRARTLQSGGLELLPPARAAHLPDVDTDDAKQIALDHRLRHCLDAPSDALANLYAVHITLSKLIASPTTTERDIHTLLVSHPIAVAPHGMRLLSEVALGRDYRIDLVIQSDLVAKRLQFIELESANKPIFTKMGRPRAGVTHAIQQVEDWIRWWREHPKSTPRQLDSAIDPDGMVVIGRDCEMSSDDRRRLASLNSCRRVQVLTYDDLLRQLEALLEHLERSGIPDDQRGRLRRRKHSGSIHKATRKRSSGTKR